MIRSLIALALPLALALFEHRVYAGDSNQKNNANRSRARGRARGRGIIKSIAANSGESLDHENQLAMFFL